MSEPTRKLVVDFPASVMEQLDVLRRDGRTLKSIVLHALDVAYGVRPAGERVPVPAGVVAEVRSVPKPGRK